MAESGAARLWFADGSLAGDPGRGAQQNLALAHRYVPDEVYIQLSEGLEKLLSLYTSFLGVFYTPRRGENSVVFKIFF